MPVKYLMRFRLIMSRMFSPSLNENLSAAVEWLEKFFFSSFLFFLFRFVLVPIEQVDCREKN